MIGGKSSHTLHCTLRPTSTQSIEATLPVSELCGVDGTIVPNQLRGSIVSYNVTS